MAFKIIKTAPLSVDSPEALFRDIRTKRIPGLLSQQADLLRVYVAQAQNKPDVALQLSTGSGKTLVGLLIGEWRRRKFKERILYLCPTNQLVHQVVNLANSQYGLKVNGFVGKKSEYDPTAKGEYLEAEAIAITSYSSLFNTNPFFDEPNTIILDDAHSAENYISKQWSMQILRSEHEGIYKAVVAVFLDLLSPSDQRRLVESSGSAWDRNWVEKIPTPSFLERIPELIGVLDARVEDSEISYRWKLLRDHLPACHIFFDASEVLVRPIIPPTFTHAPFTNAGQRIYMSATLGEGGDLERIMGRPDILRLQVNGWERQGIGRRFFLFPERSLKDAETKELIHQTLDAVGRSLIIVPDDNNAQKYRDTIKKELGFLTFNARDIEKSKEPFISQAKAAAVVANRYDGIDFPNDECRLLIVAGLPTATNLQEKFFITRLGAVALLNDRILTRIVQAFGRCTRSATDFSAVIVAGAELSSYLLAADRRCFLHPELQAELQFGIDQSKEQTVASFIDNLAIFLQQDKDWQEVDSEIVGLRDTLTRKSLPGTLDLQKAVEYEIAYQNCLWNQDYAAAFDACRSVLTELNDPALRGYRALWSYLAGSAAWLAFKAGLTGFDQHARGQYANAKGAAPAVSWLVGLSHVNETPKPPAAKDTSLALQVERLESCFVSLGTMQNRKYDEEEAFISKNIMENENTKFEAAQERLGRFIGYRSGKIESTGSPDPWWILHDELCLVFEDHSDGKLETTLSVTKARQAGSHPNWIRDNVPDVKDATILPVLVTPVKSVDKAALPHLKEVSVWNIEAFRSWTLEALRVVRELRRTFPGPGDLVWRATAADKLLAGNLNSEFLVGMLNNLPAEKMLESK